MHKSRYAVVNAFITFLLLRYHDCYYLTTIRDSHQRPIEIIYFRSANTFFQIREVWPSIHLTLLDVRPGSYTNPAYDRL